tara:strand:+ start:151 stop:573 length:423 start_codon:yes stop_codon:yes gene_type:complete
MRLIKQIANLIQIPFLLFFMRKIYRIQKQYIDATIIPELDHFLKTHDHTLSKGDVHKIHFYYGLAVPVTGEIFKVMKRGMLTSIGRKTLTYSGGITGEFDDFFDEESTEMFHVKDMIKNPDLDKVQTSKQRLFTQFFLKY